MHVEEISISAKLDDLDEEAQPAEQEATSQLVQVNRLRGSRVEITLWTNHFLSVRSKGVMQPDRDYTINASMLDPQPRRLLKICWQLLLISIGLCAAAVYMLVNGLMQENALVLMVVMGSALVSTGLAFYRSYDRIVFYSGNGRVPLVVLFSRLPTREACAEFAEALAEQIETAKSDSADANEALIEELKAHRRLMEEGIISARRYDIVKQRILSKHG